MEIAVADAGQGPMPAAARWLLVGSVAFVFVALALIQLAATPDPTNPERQIVLSRLFGVPFLVVIGLLSELEPQWVALGVLAVCIAELVTDMTGTIEGGALEEEIPSD